MAGIADFLDSLIGGVTLIFYCLAIGSLVWGLFVLQPWQQQSRYPAILLKTTVKFCYYGAAGLVICQLLKVVLKIWLLTAILDAWPFPQFAQTLQFQAGLIRAGLTAGFAFYLYRYLSPNPESKQHWLIACVAALPMILAGAWLVHAAGRFSDKVFLMSFTVLHQIGAAVWIGGVLQILNLWRLTERDLVQQTLWPQLLKRFSLIGMCAVGGLLATGLPIAIEYISDFNGLVGSGYGNLLLVKIMLLSLALGFAWLNKQAVLDYLSQKNNHACLYQRVPHYIEAETLVLIILLFTAASLASQPPAIDIPNLTASWQEVLHMFAPKIPTVASPTHQALLAGEPGRVAIIGQTPSEAATAWSDYNHNISGIFLAVMSLFAMLSYHKRCHWAKFWPVGFMALGVFLLFRSDAETWPLGPLGFWESTFANGEILQHRIATVLAFSLGWVELKARLTTDPDSKLPYIFPILCAFGGLMLLTHSHVGFQAKTAFLIQVGHTLMGVFAVILACGRWLELKLDSDWQQHLAGFISVFALFQISLVLMFYQEPLY